jgi:hypothetical protein
MIKIFKIEISMNTIVIPIEAFNYAKEIIEDQELGDAKPGIRCWEFNHDTNMYVYTTTEKDYSKYKGKIIKEELQQGINIYYF